MLLVDYACADCGAWQEHVVVAPIPTHKECVRCGGRSDRRFSSAGLVGGARPPAQGIDTSCSSNPGVPGLCHVGPEARRTLLARHLGDDTTYTAERKRQQEKFERQGPPALSSVVGHGVVTSDKESS